MQPDPALADILEGHFRPGFFTGVCTVVLKLFNAVFGTTGGGTAVFGKKDYQLRLVIERMVQQLALPITIVGAEIARAEGGLALSSRNGYLSAEQLEQARALSAALHSLAQAARQGQQPLPVLEAQTTQALNALGWQTDYLTVRLRDSLQSPAAEQLADTPLVALGAARLGSTRLIDNLEF